MIDTSAHALHAAGNALGGHGDHGGHGEPSMPDSPMCSMSMLFTWDTTDLCVVFRWWHVRTRVGLLLTLLAIAAFSAGYEFVRYRVRVVDNVAAQSLGVANSQGVPPSRTRLIQALAYALQVGYSYLLMLVFMTYNGWAMVSVCVGAGLGFWFWGDKAQRTMSCH